MERAFVRRKGPCGEVCPDGHSLGKYAGSGINGRRNCMILVENSVEFRSERSQVLRMEKARNFGVAWVVVCAAVVAHGVDTWVHHFLDYYNGTVLALYGHFDWFPRVDLSLGTYVGIWVVLVVGAMALTPWAFRNARFARWVAFCFGTLAFLNGIGQILLTIRGRSVGSVLFDGVSPGGYTAPVLLLATGYLFWRLWRTRRASAN
jgi:hypothetical protein